MSNDCISGLNMAKSVSNLQNNEVKQNNNLSFTSAMPNDSFESSKGKQRAKNIALTLTTLATAVFAFLFLKTKGVKNNLEHLLKNAEGKLSRSEKQIKTLDEEVLAKINEIGKKDGEITKLKSEKSKLQQEMERKSTEIDSLKQSLSGKQEQIQASGEKIESKDHLLDLATGRLSGDAMSRWDKIKMNGEMPSDLETGFKTIKQFLPEEYVASLSDDALVHIASYNDGKLLNAETVKRLTDNFTPEEVKKLCCSKDYFSALFPKIIAKTDASIASDAEFAKYIKRIHEWISAK